MRRAKKLKVDQPNVSTSPFGKHYTADNIINLTFKNTITVRVRDNELHAS